MDRRAQLVRIRRQDRKGFEARLVLRRLVSGSKPRFKSSVSCEQTGGRSGGPSWIDKFLWRGEIHREKPAVRGHYDDRSVNREVVRPVSPRRDLYSGKSLNRATSMQGAVAN